MGNAQIEVSTFSWGLPLGAANVYKLGLELDTIQCIVNDLTPMEIFHFSDPHCLFTSWGGGKIGAQLLLN